MYIIVILPPYLHQVYKNWGENFLGIVYNYGWNLWTSDRLKDGALAGYKQLVS